jgi:hypothetical protein
VPVRTKRYDFSAVSILSGGSSDDAVLAIAHAEGRVTVIDLVEKQSGRPPFSPRVAIAKFAGILKSYGISKVTGDNFAGKIKRYNVCPCAHLIGTSSMDG